MFQTNRRRVMHFSYCSGRRWALLALCCLVSGKLAADDQAPVSFNRDIRPILSDRCFTCHGPDQNTRQADLRLDLREAAIKSEAFVPGQPDESALVERVFSDDPTLVMPPPKLNKPLTIAQRELLKRWIAQGAPYQSHWSLIRVPEKVAIPSPEDSGGWTRNPIDHFVLEKLRAAGLEPAAETSRERWLRRASFDLTGLPPSLADLDAFLADDSADPYAAAADRLLASPAFGERMANDWLDAARYADTYGYQSDRDMHMWPWRDWVIRAFNENLPYNQFILWQTAGDLLPQPSRDQQLATAFNRLHRQTNEGGSIEEEFRIAYIADRVNTNATAFLGLTFECARCHDHKYDPIPQQDFYKLSAFFANIDEHGLYSHFTETAPTPALLLYEGDQEAQHRDLLARIWEKEAALAKLLSSSSEGNKDVPNRCADTVPSDSAKALSPSASQPADKSGDTPPAATARFTFDDLQPTGDYKPVTGKVGQGVEFGGDGAFTCKGAGQFSRATPFTFALWVKPALHRPRMIVLHQSVAAEDSAFRGLSLVLDDGRPVFSLIHFWPGNAIRVQAREPIPAGEWTHLAVTYDGSSHAAGLRIFVNGLPAELDVVRDQLSRDIRYRQEWGDYVSAPVEIALGARFRDVGFQGGAIDELLVFDRELTPIEVPQIAGLEVALSAAARQEHQLKRHNAPCQAALQELQTLRVEENELVGKIRQIMVLKELTGTRATHVLRRGAYDAPGEQVAPDTPVSILPFPDKYPRNRLGLARWLIDDRNPLVARVTVNRFWQLFFGRGLVATAEDFGSQGQPPSHPELLDWLAREFMTPASSETTGATAQPPFPTNTPFLSRDGQAVSGGWNVKALCKLIVLSATYRQSSVPRDPRLYADDPENRLLARGPRHRLSAEQIRDNALAVSGLLVNRLGGPSVMPYQPAGLWEESGTGKTYSQSHGEGLYRRSLYTFWRRTSPPPSQMTFDATTREVCIARRERTATPLQALVLLNDPQFVEAARALAEKLLKAHPTAVDVRIASAFRMLTSRTPTAREMEILMQLNLEQRAHFSQIPEEAKALVGVGESPRDESLDVADHAALTVVVEMILSFDECVTKR
ncbi:MAG: DUF1553 domain-containing protein [Planctomycetales bacterium]